jgi:hypothetical protein
MKIMILIGKPSPLIDTSFKVKTRLYRPISEERCSFMLE